MTINIAQFPSYLGYNKPSDGERYVVPTASLTSVPLTVTADWFGYVRETIGGVSFNPIDPSTFNAGLVAGYQVVGVGGAKIAASASGLANNSTVYTASVVIDGATTIALSIVGSTAQTFGALVTLLNNQLNNIGTCALVSGNVRITSKLADSTSSVAITDGTLFAALTGYTAVATAVAGVTPFSGMAFHKLDGATDSVCVIANKTTFDTPLDVTLAGYIVAA